MTGMPSGPEAEDSLDVDRAARSSTFVMGSVTSGEGGGCLLRTLA